MVDNSDKDPINVEMGRRIAAQRKKRGWTQKALAERTGWSQRDDDEGKARGYSPSRIGNYEQGTRRLSVEEAEMLSSIFDGIPAAYFLCLIDEHEARVLHAMRTDRPKMATAKGL